MLDWIRNAWMGWQQYTEKGRVVALFLAVLLFLWFGQKCREKQKLLLCYSAVMTVLCICPLTAAVLMMYQTRFYDYQWIWSMVPVTLVTAWGGVVFLTGIWRNDGNNKKVRALAITLGLAGILFLCGGLGQRDGQQDAEWAAKRSGAGAVLAEVEECVQGNNICLWAPQEIMEAARSCSGEIRLPYGRNMWDPALNAYVYGTYDESLCAMYQWMSETDELIPEAELIEELRPAEEDKEAWRTQGQVCFAAAQNNGVNTFLFPGDLDAEYVQWIQEQLNVPPKKVQGYYLFCPAR